MLCMSVSLLSTYLPTYLSVCLSTHPSIHPFYGLPAVRPFIHPAVFFSNYNYWWHKCLFLLQDHEVLSPSCAVRDLTSHCSMKVTTDRLFTIMYVVRQVSAGVWPCTRNVSAVVRSTAARDAIYNSGVIIVHLLILLSLLVFFFLCCFQLETVTMLKMGCMPSRH